MTEKVKIQLKLNGEEKSLHCYPLTRLLDLIREEAKLTGTKEGCGEGECGACSVFVNGKLVNSCLVPAFQMDGAEIETIEGVAHKDQLDEVQKSFLKFGGAQCGICTPGMVMASINILREKPNASLDEIKEGLAGNLCRCTGFLKIFDSVNDALKKENHHGGPTL